MAEQLICNQQVVGSTPTTSSKRGKIPEWPKGADCKSVGTAFGGSNPPLPTKKESIEIPMLSFFVRKRVDEEPLQSNRSHRCIQQRRRCSLYIFLLCPLWRFVVYIYKLPNAEAIHLFQKNRGAVFFMLGIVDSARFTPRGALRHEPPFGAGRFAMRASTLALALIRIHLFPP